MNAQQTCADSHGSAQGARARLELADIVREYRAAYARRYPVTPTESAVLDAIERCRTAALGGHVDVCLACGHQRPSYNSCHNRHCPKCPAVAQAKWIAGRLERVLPTHYFHVVFTLPAELRGLAFSHPDQVYALLFRCASDTLLELGRDEQRLGGELGLTLVLHTWARDLSYHPHVHAIVTGGALTGDDRWRPAPPEYLFPVAVMARLFRGKMLAELRRVQRRGELRVSDEPSFHALVAQLYRKNWIVYCKRPFGGPEQVVRYLGQYTHRVGIANQRLVAMDERGVTFRTKNGQCVTLDGVTFLRRWLCHVLPPRFVKIRHFGLMSAAHARTRLEVARTRLAPAPSPPDPTALPTPPGAAPPAIAPPTLRWREVIVVLTGIDLGACPRCGNRALERSPLPRAPPCTQVREAA
ncbi:MAG: IS91 family transposase [Coriobacteriia bacterium]|nr:IS91 family transposase [Coriobacteriia bacterium]